MAQVQHLEDGQVAKPNTWWIWRTFWILLAITALEFLIALGMPFIPHGIKVGIYVFLTLFKAGYIIGEFMHLKYEVKFLFFAILLPMIFVVWLVIALMWEGGSIFGHIY